MSTSNADDGRPSGRPVLLDSDALIDEILREKGSARYKDGLSEDNWEEASCYKEIECSNNGTVIILVQELEQIPLFMTKVPDEIDPVKGAGILALQELKYREDDPNCK